MRGKGERGGEMVFIVAVVTICRVVRLFSLGRVEM